MEIYFLRHGDAVKKSGGKGGDGERPLSTEGTALITREAGAIALLRLGLDLIMTSPLVRARQTAEIVARELRLPGALAIDERLAPGFGPNALLSILREHRANTALLLVGHEPDFSQTIAACIGGGRVECGKGGLARVDLDDPDSIRGTLAWLLPARVLAP
jgi:phosphohistidine phosphatase